MSRFELPLTTNEESLREKCFSVAAVIDRRYNQRGTLTLVYLNRHLYRPEKRHFAQGRGAFYSFNVKVNFL